MKQSLIIIGAILFTMLSYSCGEKLTLNEQIIKDISTIKAIRDCHNIPKEAEFINVTVDSTKSNLVYGSDNMYVVSVAYDYVLDEETTHIENSFVYFKHGESYDFSKAVGGCDK